MPSLIRRTPALLALAALLVAGACTTSPSAENSRSLTSVPTGVTTTRTPLPDPPPPTRSPPGPEATELLEFALDPGRGSTQGMQVERAGDITLINAVGRLVALDADGDELWKIVERYTDIPTLEVRVLGSVAVVSRDAFGIDVFPNRLLITGIDVATGRILWKNTTSAFVSFVGGTMITSECAPKQTGALGECTITARDPKTGREQWHQKSYASARVEDPLDGLDVAAPEELWVTSYPTGADSERRDAFELATGSPLGVGRAGEEFGGSQLLVALGLGVFFTDDGDPEDNGCRPRITAVRVPDRTDAWNRDFVLGTYPSADGKQVRCSRLDAEQQDVSTASIVEQGTPQLLDLSTGRTVWDHATEGEALRAVTQDAVLTTKGTDTADNRLVARARSDGRELWMQELTVQAVTAAAAKRDAWLLVDADVQQTPWTLVLSPRSGELVAVGLGELVGHGDGWFAAYSADYQADNYGKPAGVRVYRMP
ncbi:MAG: PQQ-binding-like beta-propeller repeat protein [Nakamurella sp.]